MRVLFVCSRNRLRSPTAEQHFSNWPGLEVTSPGLRIPDDFDFMQPELLEQRAGPYLSASKRP
jgi:predicted protein tyrosine phosphatase